MKKKELLRRLSAISMAAMMTVTAVPANTFAADIEFSDGEMETADTEENADISVEENDADSAGDQAEDFAAEEPVIANEENADFSAYAGDDLFSDGAEAAGDADEDARAAAAAYLKENYVDKNKIIINGGTGITKGEDGLTYSVGLKVNGTGNDITSINFKKESSSSSYKSGWYINSEWVDYGSRKPATAGSVSITRPTAEQGPQSFKAVLRLFSSDTATDTINDETQAAQAALAEQEFTVTIEAAEPNYTLTVKVQDEDGNPINDATVTLEKDWNAVSPKEDGSYEMEKGAQYTLTVKKDGYNDYKESSFTFNPTEVNTVKTVTLKKMVTRNIRFNVTDKSGNPVNGASVSVTKSYSTVKPESDGSYNLIDGTSYNYKVEATNYKTVTGSITPSQDQTIDVALEKDINEYKVSINPVDNDGKAIANASIKVTYEEEDPWDEDETETVELKANADGTYTMQKGVTYTYTVTAPDYSTVTDTYTPSGNDENVSINVKLVTSVDPADEQTVNAIKAKFDAEKIVFRPNFATDKNILDLVKSKIAGYTDIDTTGVTVSVKSSDDTDWIEADGTIHYRAQAPDQWGNNVKNVSLSYVFEKNGAKAETESTTVTIGWDRDYFNAQMKSEKDSLTWDKIKGSNTDAKEVTTDLTLPQCMTTSARTAWSQITWTSSNESVISIKGSDIDSMIDPKTGVVTQPQEDTEVTLTATFTANDTLLNSYVEKVSDFATLTAEFKVTVKGTGVSGATEEELQAILDKYYTEDRITNFNDTNQVADLKNCTYDLQLPRYTRIKDESGEYVFNNKEITVTTDNDAIKINGYRAAVDRFASNEDLTVNLIVTFTRDEVTAVKKIPVTIKPVTEAEVQDQLDLMNYAKEHYFDGINDGQYADKSSVTGDLHPFQELTADRKWIYNNDDKTGQGIIPDDQFTDPWEMEGAGYNKFKSSNNAVVAHENLVVTRRETDTEITISSVLSSELYKNAAESHPDNKVLQKLYKQPVSVTVIIKGTKSGAEGLQNLIDEAQKLLDEMTEGTEIGQYKKGSKAKLQAAIDDAKEVLSEKDVTEEELSDAILELQKAIDAAKDAQNAAVAAVTVRVNMASQPAKLSALTVTSKDAAAYGFEKPEATKNQVTVVDALYTLHKALYGEAFDKNPSQYLEVAANGWINTIFEDTSGDVGYCVNNKYPTDDKGEGTVATTTVLKGGDTLSIYMLADKDKYTDEYIYFGNIPEEVCVGKEIPVAVKGISMLETAEKKEADCTVELKNLDTNETAEFVTNGEGIANVKAGKAGKYQLTVTKTPYQYYVEPLAQFEVKNHTFDAGKVTKEPTCAATGEKTYTCTVCGATKKEEIAKTNNHSYDAGKVTKEPTCAATGIKTYTCTVCGATRTEEIAKTNNHSYDAGKVTKEPTCAATGIKTYTCTVCGATRTEEIAKTNNHSYDAGKVTKEPTCAATGIKTYTCTVCGVTRTEEIAKTNNHSYDTGKVTKEPTCAATGEKTYTCTVCGATKKEEIAKTNNHSYDAGKVTKEPTCAATGIKTYTCTVCGVTKTEEIAKTNNHSYDAGKVTKEPTCAEPGIKTYTCTVCGATKTEEIAKTDAHTFDEGKVTKEPTCAETGIKTYTCTVCGATKTEEIAKTDNHTFDEGKVTKEPTCAEAGIKTYTCTVCGTTKTEEIAKTDNHTFDEGKVTKEPTCVEAGEKTYTCTVCGATKTEEIAKTDAHTFDEGKVTKEPTCAEAGEKTYTCTVCGATKTEEIAKTDAHTFDEGKVTKEPTCAEAGEKTYTCTVCGATKTEEIAKTDAHTFDKGVVTKKATYTATGIKTYTCTVCGVTKTETIPVVAHSHKYVWKTISKATINQPQKQKGTCSLCKKTTTRNYGSKLKATIKLNVSSITLQKKQATKRVRVTMANGDSIKSWTSSNRKIVTVDKNGRIQAQNRTGSAKITVTLKSGKKATLNVKVQSSKVRTTKISGLKSSMTLKKGQKTTLKPVLSPLTTTEKVTYTSSNKNIATVSSKGVITAKKKGTAKITVRSGKKSYVIKVTVK